MAEERESLAWALATRLCASLFGASLFGLLAAALDALWASRSATEPPSFASVFMADAGLIAVPALLCGVAVGFTSGLLHPRTAPSVGRLSLFLRDPDAERRAYFAALAPLSALGTALFVVVDAKATLHFFASDARAHFVAIGAALAACLLAVLIAICVFGLARLVAKFWQNPPDPLWSLVFGVALSIALLGVLIAVGETSGAGGVFAVFGVLKRPELDLRAPLVFAFIALGAYTVPALVRRLPAVALLGFAVLPVALAARAMHSGLDERRVAISIERGAPTGKLVLRTARKLTDRDKDGFSAVFGGGDCDDRDDSVNPGADDVPGNGRDEDCSGQDDMAVSLKASRAADPVAGKAAAPAVPKQLNVVLITVDTLRYDLGYAGNPRPLSPNLDRLAKQSVVFDRAYSLASYTSKSLPPLLIGKYPSETHRGWNHFNRFSREDTFLQERLQRAGIRTLSVQGYWYFFNQGVGFERGFDVIDSSAAPKVVQMEGDRTTNSDKISDAALAQLAKPENTSGRFFLWIHYIDPHTEYVKHDEFDFGSGSRERYDGEVAFVDKHVGRVVDFIQKSEFGKRTAVVVTSDHGEAFGEHGMIRHGFEVWEELVRVPLIVHVPGITPRRIAERRSAIDLVPTLLDFYELPKPAGEGNDFISGESLVSDLYAGEGHAPKQKIVFVDMAAGPNNAERQAFIENDLKLITSDGRPLGLYDLEADAAEKRDLLDEDSSKKTDALARFKAFRRELRVVNVKAVPKE